jgi:FKBP-type peptidyl-prolyl cis-trans isomerase
MPPSSTTKTPLMKEGDTVELRPGLTKTVTKTGDGVKPDDEAKCTMHYHGTLNDGTVFDSTRGKKPFKFHLASFEVIKGWDISVATMTKGEKAIVHIPSEYGYGPAAVGPIPANSELTFELELVSWRNDKYDTFKIQFFCVICIFIAVLVYVPGVQEGRNRGFAG